MTQILKNGNSTFSITKSTEGLYYNRYYVPFYENVLKDLSEVDYISEKNLTFKIGSRNRKH